MTLETLLAAIPLPKPAVYTRAIGTVGASMYTYTADQLRADREAVALAVARYCARDCPPLAANLPEKRRAACR